MTIKIFCDVCEKEIKKGDAFGELFDTYSQQAFKELKVPINLCDKCKKKIQDNLDMIIKKLKGEKK